MYGLEGVNLLDSLKQAAATGVREAKASLLARGGEAIASTPEGQQAIKDSLFQQGSSKLQSAISSVPPIMWYGLVGSGLYLLFSRRRGRR